MTTPWDRILETAARVTDSIPVLKSLCVSCLRNRGDGLPDTCEHRRTIAELKAQGVSVLVYECSCYICRDTQEGK